jgi:nucleoid-associated protein YejK
MNLNSIIVHRLDKEVNGVPSLTLRENVLPVTIRETEFVTNVKQVYYKKSNPNYGVLMKMLEHFHFKPCLEITLMGMCNFYSLL